VTPAFGLERLLHTLCQPRGEPLRKPGLEDLLLRALDRVGAALELRAAPIEIEEQPRRTGVPVAGLTDRAGIQQPAVGRAEIDLRPLRGEAALERLAQADRHGDMGVSDEHERSRGVLERGESGLRAEDVLPDRLAGTAVVQRRMFRDRARLQSVQIGAVGRGEDGGSPAGSLGRLRREVGEIDLAEHAEVVVADQPDRGVLLGERAARARLRPIADHVAKAPDGVRTRALDGGQDRFEGVEVGVDVGDDGDPHRGRARLPRAALVVLGVAAAAGVAIAAYFLLRTEVPKLDQPSVDPGAFFTDAELDRIEAYRRLPRWLWVASTLVELVVLGVLAWKGRALARWLERRVHGRVRVGLLLGLTAVGAVWLATLPLAAVGHWWQRRYGLSEQGYGAWLGDQAVSLAVLAVLVSIAVAGALFLAARLGRRWWIAGAAGLAVLGVAYVLLQPVVIQPLFNRFEPLPDRALAARIEALGEQVGVHVDQVDVADASRRTTAANALVTGLGPTRRIALYDTLLDGRFTQDQIVAVVAHELAHVKRAHVWKGAAWFVLFAVPGVALVAFALNRRGGPGDPGLVPLALLCAFVLSLAVLPAANAISRRYEAEADWLALVATRDPQAVAGLVRGLAVASLADPDPPGWSQQLLGTHPSPLDRIAMAEAYARRP